MIDLFSVSPEVQSARGLISRWKVVPEAYGGRRLLDAVGRAHGTLVGMSPSTATSGWNGSWRPGGYGELRYDGISDAVDLGTPVSLDLTGPMALIAWCQPATVNNSGIGGMPVVSAGSDPFPDQAYGLLLGRNDGPDLTVRWADFDILEAAPLPLADNEPHYVGFSRSGSVGNWTAAVYLDGRSVATTSTTINPVSVIANGGVVMIGKRGGATPRWTGRLDDVLVFNRGLTANDHAEVVGALRSGEAQETVRLASAAWPGLSLPPRQRRLLFWRRTF